MKGCVPNLRGASPVGRGDGGRSYAARTVGGVGQTSDDADPAGDSD